MTLGSPRFNSIAKRRPRLGPRLGQVHIAYWRLGVAALLILGWQAASGSVSGNFVPSPRETLLSAEQLLRDGTLLSASSSSLVVFATGYLAAIAFAVPFGLLMGGFRVFGAAVEPFVDAFSAMPRVSFIPLIIVFLGLGYEAKICVVFLGAIMPILINTYAGVLNSDADLIEMARSAGASDAQIFRKVMLPGALPYIIAGARVGAALALINTVVAELYTAVQGLGGLLAVYGNTFRMAPYFVVVFALAGIGVMTMTSLRLLERRLMRHQVRG